MSHWLGGGAISLRFVGDNSSKQALQAARFLDFVDGACELEDASAWWHDKSFAKHKA
jgi:hypothetical protein